MKLKPLERKALTWNDVPHAEELKEDFRKFNECYKILTKQNQGYFHFVNDLLRSNYNKPYFNSWQKPPEELTEYCDKLKEKLQRFLEQGVYFTLKEQKEPKWNHNYNENDNNLMIEVSDFASYKKSFKKTFKFIDKTYNLPSTFTVEYGDLKAKQLPYFSTSASNKYQGGQTQDELLPKYHILREFWEQWKMYHCRPLTKYEYNCLLKDLEIVENELANMNN